MDARDLDRLPDVRDGLSRKERVVLYCIHQLQKERGGRNVPTAMLYGRVLEHVDMSEQELQDILQRLTNPT
jgi:DNA gyrase/topoisomerase IV subunit A